MLLSSRSCAFWSPFFFFSSRVPLRSVSFFLATVPFAPGSCLRDSEAYLWFDREPLWGVGPAWRDNRQVLAPSCQPCPFSLSLTLSLPLLSSGVFGVPSRGWSLSLGLDLALLSCSPTAPSILKVGENN